MGEIDLDAQRPMNDSENESRGSPERKSVLRNALAAIDALQAKISDLERAKTEPIAIVGLSCRLPGAPSVDAYWDLLTQGRCSVTEVPDDRWDKAAFFDPDPEVAGKMHAAYGGFLEGIKLFDAAFFGISGREAESMDPQQRLLLEGTWEALENAGISVECLKGSQTGVFVGITTSDYGRMAVSRETPSLDVYTATGGALNVAAGRIAYTLGFNGPAVAIDSACSSSLVAVHLACQSLRSHECDLAIAAGVNVLLSPEPFVCFAKWGMMARDGRCKTFDEKADGFVRSEGCGVVVLKRLCDAQAAGDRILALIRGSAVNQDGASSGLTVPNGPAQQAVVRTALKNAHVSPESIDYVEAHGTGTTLGDPIELEALASVLGLQRPAGRPLVVGSVKTNIGHTESASGVAGLIKVVLALQNEEIPAHLHFEKLNPRISLGSAAIEIPVTGIPWPRSERSRMAGVSSFGFSGTNAHLIVQEAPREELSPASPRSERTVQLLVLSARSKQALGDLARNYASFFSANRTMNFADACHTAGVGRAALPHRLALVTDGCDSATAALKSYACGEDVPKILVGKSTGYPRVAFVFPGESTELRGIGKTLYDEEPVFREAFDRCAEIVGPHLDHPLQEIIGYTGNLSLADLLKETSRSHLALFALEYAHAALWRDWGIEPTAVAGDGLGEYVAACVAGVLTLEDALLLVVARSQLAQTPGFPVGHPLDQFERSARKVNHRPPAIDLVLNLTGELSGESSMDAVYWGRHARETSHFEKSIQTLCGRGITTFLTMGLASSSIETNPELGNDAGTFLLSSRGESRDIWPQLLKNLAALFVAGANPNWNAFDRGFKRRRVSAPVYPFQRTHFWLPESAPRPGQSQAHLRSGMHPLLGAYVQPASHGDEHLWQNELSFDTCPWIDDHRVQGNAIVPATAYIEMAIAAATKIAGAPPVILTELKIEKPLLLRQGLIFDIQTQLKGEKSGSITFTIFSRARATTGDWTFHASGLVRIEGSNDSSTSLNSKRRAEMQKNAFRFLEGAEFYHLHHARGNEWGSLFQGVGRVWQLPNGEALGEIVVPPGIRNELEFYQLHPALSDTSGHILTATIHLDKSDNPRGGAFVGAGVDEVRFYRRPEGHRLWSLARLRPDQDGPPNILVGDVSVFDETGEIIAETRGARLWYLDSTQTRDAINPVDSWFHEPRWINCEAIDQLKGSLSNEGLWLVFRDQKGVGDALGAQLRARGIECLFVDHDAAVDRNGILIEPTQLLAYTNVLAVARDKKTPIRGIVHLWSLDAADAEKADSAAEGRAQELGVISVLHLLQAMDSISPAITPKLWLITSGAQPADSTPTTLSIFQSPIWGLGRTVAVEKSNIWGGQIDLDPAALPPTSASHIFKQILNPDREDQVAFRNGVRKVLRLAKIQVPVEPAAASLVRADATYLITGGLGGIGLEFGRWLVEQGARHLILAGRTPLPPREKWETEKDPSLASRIEAVRAIERLGADVVTTTTDFADETSVRKLVTECLQPDKPTLRGVFHAAGMMQYEALATQTADRMRAVLAAKITGGWILHRMLSHTPLDLFVLFSSSSSLLSSPLMGGYSAANVFLDALAHHRRGLGLPAMSINWGTWAETGMATRFQTTDQFQHQGRSGATKGIGVLSTQRAMQAWKRLLDRRVSQAGVIPIDWDVWQKSYGPMAASPYLSLVVTPPFSPSEGRPRPSDEWRNLILNTPPNRRRETVEKYLVEQMSAILKTPLDTIDADQSIANLGFDSLMSIELKNKIEADLHLNVAMARLIQGPTVTELTGIIMEDLLNEPQETPPSRPDLMDRKFEEGSL